MDNVLYNYSSYIYVNMYIFLLHPVLVLILQFYITRLANEKHITCTPGHNKILYLYQNTTWTQPLVLQLLELYILLCILTSKIELFQVCIISIHDIILPVVPNVHESFTDFAN